MKITESKVGEFIEIEKLQRVVFPGLGGDPRLIRCAEMLHSG
jgi:hypothetical protein